MKLKQKKNGLNLMISTPIPHIMLGKIFKDFIGIDVKFHNANGTTQYINQAPMNIPELNFTYI